MLLLIQWQTICIIAALLFGCSANPLITSLIGENVRENDKIASSINFNEAVKEGNITKIPLNETASTELLEHWLSQAVSGLMAAVASRRLPQLGDEDQDELEECSKQAKTVPEHAKCVVRVIDKTQHQPVTINKKVNEQKASMIKRKEKPRIEDDQHTQQKKQTNPTDLQWTGSFALARAKRSIGDRRQRIRRINRYELSSKADETILTQVAKSMTNTLRVFKKKDKVEGWRKAIVRIKDIGNKAKEEKKQQEKMKERLRHMISNTPPKYVDPRKPIAMQQMMEEEERLNLKKMAAKKDSEAIRVPLNLMRDAVKMALQLAGKNVSDFDTKTLKLASPRMMSIMPEQEDDSLVNLLSPSLFSLHDEGEGVEKQLSLPHLLNKLDMKDQEAWLDFIVEAAGVTDTADKMENKLKEEKERRLRDENGMPLYLTKENLTRSENELELRKVEVFEHLDKTYTKQQKAELDQRGYSYLSLKQMDKIYGKDSPYAVEKKRLGRMKRLRRLHDDPEHLIEHDIRALAEAKKFHSSLRKDIVLSPIVATNVLFAGETLSNTFVVLSPIVFSPIVLSPAVLGPIILSPWVFIPLILSPRVMGPLVLSPLIFSPLILSPLVLHPLILVPGIFNPVILTPLLLSPLILSPQVFTPIILSPLCLNPLILTPMVGSPLILSPFVLSPIILSPQALFAVVLSPYALSPLVESKLIASEVVLSPSWLS